nr:IS3 family transposase [Bacillus sp. 1NLA3E]
MKNHQHEFRVVKMCSVFGVSKSGYYDWLKRDESEQRMARKRLTEEIKNIYYKSKKRYGSIKITRELRKTGFSVSERHVQRIMTEEGMKSITAQKFKATTNSDHDKHIYPNLLEQNFKTSGPGVAWVSDITYIWTRQGWLYLASVMDLYSRKIIGFSMSSRMTKELVIQALERAVRHQPPKKGLIHHSDRGSQYASKEYTKILKDAEIQISMSGKGNCYDNACIESFHSVIKKELIFHKDYKTRKEAKSSIFDYILSFYNSWRIHSTLDYSTPNEFEKAYYLKNEAA